MPRSAWTCAERQARQRLPPSLHTPPRPFLVLGLPDISQCWLLPLLSANPLTPYTGAPWRPPQDSLISSPPRRRISYKQIQSSRSSEPSTCSCLPLQLPRSFPSPPVPPHGLCLALQGHFTAWCSSLLWPPASRAFVLLVGWARSHPRTFAPSVFTA